MTPNPPGAGRRCVHCGAPLSAQSRASGCGRCMLATALVESASAAARPAPPRSGSPASSERDIPFGDYVLEEEIAHGGMGVVYRARHPALSRTVAVKLLLLGRHASRESIDRFRREARSAAALRHPNIVVVHDVGETDGQHFIAMELVEGRNLAEVLREGLSSPRTAAAQARTIAEAIHYAHGRGVLHRDLKPSNILVDPFGELRITDFGLAKRLDGSNDLTETGRLLGSPNYLSPEAAAGRPEALGPASDLYALGAMLYELLTGRPPFLAPSLPDTLQRIRDAEPVSPSRLNPAVPVDLETICLKCLEKQPDSRYASAQDLADDLGRWLRNEPITARPVPGWERAWKWSRRNPRVAGLLALTALASVGLVTTLALANLRIRAANARTAVEAEESRRRLVQLNVQTGNRFVSDGEPLTAVAWFVEALALEHGDPAREDVHRRRIGALLRQAPELEQVWFHDAFVTDAKFSPDGTRVAAVSMEGTAKLWDAITGQALLGPERAFQARFSPDNRYLLTWSSREGIRLWNLAEGAPATNLPPIRFGGVDLSPDGRWLAVPSRDGPQLLEVATGEPRGEPWRAAHSAATLRFSPDGRWLAGLGGQNQMTIWDTTSEGTRHREIALGGPVLQWEFRRDGSRFAVVMDGGRVRQWDVATGEPAGPDLAHPSPVYSVQYSPDGLRLVTAEWAGAAHLWDATTGLTVGVPMTHQGGVRWARYSPDGRRLATASWDTTVRFWDPATGHPRPPVLRHGGFVTSLDFSPDGARLVTGSQDTALRLWRMATNAPARLVLGHEGTIFRTRYNPEGTRIVTAGEDGTARVWDRDSGRLLLTVRHEAAVIEARFSPDGRHLLTGSIDGTARLWDAATGEPLFPGVAHGTAVWIAEFSPDGRQFVTKGAGSTVRVWEAATGAPVTPLLDHGAPVSSVAFHPDGKRLLVAGHDGIAQVWDLATAQPSGPRLKVGGKVRSATFSPDGSRILTSWADEGQLPSAAQLWDTASGEKLTRPMGHLDGIYCAEFSRDGRRVVTSSEDNTARVWDAATGEPVTPPLRHRGYVYHAAFSPDGRLVATASEDGTARVWETETGEAVTPPLVHEGRAGWVGWSPDGREIATGWNQNAGRVFDVSPHHGTVDRLRIQAELLGSQRLHPTSGAAPLTTAELRERWRAFSDAVRK